MKRGISEDEWMEKMVSIRIKRKTRELLKEHMILKGDTYNDVIERIMVHFLLNNRRK